MKSLIITVAGMATRFSESVGKPCLKCSYFKDSFEKSLINRMVRSNEREFDKIIIVGGFMFDELKKIVLNYFCDLDKKLILLYNDHFRDYGSGYSLYLGMIKAISIGSTQIVFAEGDLYFDNDSFKHICSLNKDAVSINSDPIFASKAVAFYFDKREKIHYIFDTTHGELEIREPFIEIRNSGQVWKFVNVGRLSNILNELSEDEKKGTNLIIIQKYYGMLGRREFDIISFNEWINCNTVDDFKLIDQIEKQR